MHEMWHRDASLAGVAWHLSPIALVLYRIFLAECCVVDLHHVSPGVGVASASDHIFLLILLERVHT